MLSPEAANDPKPTLGIQISRAFVPETDVQKIEVIGMPGD
jgi:hypothetical protein